MNEPGTWCWWLIAIIEGPDITQTPVETHRTAAPERNRRWSPGYKSLLLSCPYTPSKMGQLYRDSPCRQGTIHLSANETNLQSLFSQDHRGKALNTILHRGHDALALQKLEIRLFSPHRNYYQHCTMLQESTEKIVYCTPEILTVMFKEMVVWAPFLKSNEKSPSQRSI